MVTKHRNHNDRIGLAAQWAGGKPRTCEDLKERYYKVARSLQVAWEGSEEGAANLTLVKHPFNAQHERCAPPLLIGSRSAISLMRCTLWKCEIS